MARRDRRITQGAHIKRNTHGTSNELSFSVLDAAKNTADATDPLQREDPFWADAGEEVTRRKRKRRRRRLRAQLAAAAVAVTLAGLSAWALYAGLQTSQEMQAELARAVGLIEEADEAILPFDEVVVRAMTEPAPTLSADDFPAAAEEALAKLDGAMAKMDEARATVEAVQPSLRSARDLEASNEMLRSLNARRNMAASGREAAEAASATIQAYGHASKGWELLLSADTSSRDAAALASLAGEANMRASLGKTEEAIAGFSQAKDEFTVAQSLAPEAGMAAYADYAALRLEAQQAALASGYAFLASDVEGAVQENNRYNSLDSEAANLMRGMGHDPAAQVEALFNEQRATLFESYRQARAQASDADAFLNDYVGAMGR